MIDTIAGWGPPGFIPERTFGQLRDRVQAGTRFDIDGAGPAVMLVHGVGLDLAMWDDVAARLARDFTIIRYDMLGHGGSAKVNEPMTLGSFVRQLEDFADYLRLDRFALVGFSMGAMVAQGYALAHPGRPAALALLNSVHDRTAEQQRAVRARLSTAEAEGPQAIIGAAIERWFSPAFRQSRPEVVATIRERLRGNDRHGFLNAYRVFAEADQALVDRVGGIACPALVATGENDTGSTPDMSRRLAAAIPDGRAAILPGLAHMAPVEDGAAVAGILMNFLKKQALKTEQ
jgi:pimeloyl-ACP methyl ester carboxylesterase